MGEIADMMLDGTLCSCCGDFLDQNFDLDGAVDGVVEDTSPGFPMMCAACEFEMQRHDVPAKPTKSRRRAARTKRVAKPTVE
jgi:hypothetical protein